MSGIGYRMSLVVTGWAISLLCTNGLREQCVLTHLVCSISDLTTCDYGTVPTSSIPVLVCLQYANTEGEGLGDLVTCSYIR